MDLMQHRVRDLEDTVAQLLERVAELELLVSRLEHRLDQLDPQENP